MKIVKFTEISDELRNDWGVLWKSSAFANIVNSPAWTLAAHRTYGYENLLIISIYDDQKANLQAVTALVKEKLFGISIWTAPGIEFADKCSILANLNDKDIMRSLMSEMMKLGIVYLPYCKQDEIMKIREHLPQSTAFKSEVDLYMDFSKGKYGKYPHKKRKNLLNRIENMKTQLDFATTSADDNKALEACFEIDKASIKQSKGRGVFYKNDARKFYKELSGLLPENVPLSVLYLNKKPVSYQIGFLVNNVYSATQKAYLEGFEYYNPGKLTLIKLIDHYCKKGLPFMEFGRGCDRSKRDFTSSYYVLYNLIISRNALLNLYFKKMHDLRTNAYHFVSGHAKLYRFYKKVKEVVIVYFSICLVHCGWDLFFFDAR